MMDLGKGVCVYVMTTFLLASVSVVQADEFPECEDLRDAILVEFKKSVFTRKTFEEVNNVNRGPYARVNLELIQGAVGHSCKAIRTVGVCEQIIYQKLKSSRIKDFCGLWGRIKILIGCPEAFPVPKANGKWRLV